MTGLIRRQGCGLVLVDYQTRLMPAIDGVEQVMACAEFLAEIAALLHVPVLGTEQNPEGLGSSAPSLARRCEAILAKHHFNDCEDGLVDLLQVHGIMPGAELVVAGCESHVCLLQTCTGLLQAGFCLWVVAPACGSRFAEDKQFALERLRDLGAQLVTAEMVAFEWLRTCRDPQFKDALALIKRFSR